MKTNKLSYGSFHSAHESSVDVLVGFYVLQVRSHIKHVVLLVALHSCHHFTCCQCSHILTFHLYVNSLQIL